MNDASAFWRLVARGGGGSRGACGLLLACAAHGSLLTLARTWTPATPAWVPVTEVALLPPAAPAPEPAPPAAEPPAPATAPRTHARPRVAAPARAPAPSAASEPAHAGALRAAEETTREPDLVRFVTDPDGADYGFGAVARGGRADTAPPGTGAPGPASGPPARSTAPISSRPPQLAERDPCRGYFPRAARVDQGDVALRVRVDRDGSVRSVAVAREAPLGHGFGVAARDCLRAKRFSPALDGDGRPVAVVSPVTVHFSR